MNPNRSKRISHHEISELLPSWFVDNYTLVFQLLRTNQYSNFQTIKTFLTAALQDLACDEEERKTTPVKHVKVKVTDQGVKDYYQYVSVDIYPILRDGTTLRITNSCKVQLRKKMGHD